MTAEKGRCPMPEHSITRSMPSSSPVTYELCATCHYPVSSVDSQGRCLDCAKEAADEEWRKWWQGGKP